MAAITLTPVDISTAPVVVNSDIIYHVFTIDGVTRVFFSKGGKSPYQVDVQESAASIAAASPNLVEVTTVNGAEYLFIGSGGAGTGLGIMFIETDTNGSKITFKYHEESGTTTIYSLDAPSVITARINALAPIPSTNPTLTLTIPISNSDCVSAYSSPVPLILSPGPGYAIVITSLFVDHLCTVDFDNNFWAVGSPSSGAGQYQWWSSPIGTGSTKFLAPPVSTWQMYAGYPLAPSLQTIFENEGINFFALTMDSTVGDGSYTLTLNYQIIAVL